MLPQLLPPSLDGRRHRAFREQVRRYVAAELAPHLEGWRRQGYIPREVWRPFGQLGFLLPELDGSIWRRRAPRWPTSWSCRTSWPRPSSRRTRRCTRIAAHYILDYGTEAQKRRWLPKLASGELLGRRSR